jgi:hypothetical protein
MRLRGQKLQKHVSLGVQSPLLKMKVSTRSYCYWLLPLFHPADSITKDQSLIGVAFEDIKTLAPSMSSVTFRVVSRLCNNSAHALARRAELYGSFFFHDSAPDFIREKLFIDVF